MMFFQKQKTMDNGYAKKCEVGLTMSKLMKKLFSFIFAFCFMVSLVSFAVAETTDLSSLSNDEVLDLLKQVQQEVVDRKLSKSAELSAGMYIVGGAFPSGLYVISSDDFDGYFTVNFRDNFGGGNEGMYYYERSFSSIKPSWMVYLSDGDKLICSCQIKLTIAPGIVFE